MGSGHARRRSRHIATAQAWTTAFVHDAKQTELPAKAAEWLKKMKGVPSYEPSRELKDLLSEMLSVKENRISAQEVLDHEWLEVMSRPSSRTSDTRMRRDDELTNLRKKMMNKNDTK